MIYRNSLLWWFFENLSIISSSQRLCRKEIPKIILNIQVDEWNWSHPHFYYPYPCFNCLGAIEYHKITLVFISQDFLLKFITHVLYNLCLFRKIMWTWHFFLGFNISLKCSSFWDIAFVLLSVKLHFLMTFSLVLWMTLWKYLMIHIFIS